MGLWVEDGFRTLYTALAFFGFLRHADNLQLNIIYSFMSLLHISSAVIVPALAGLGNWRMGGGFIHPPMQILIIARS
jgi:hypothetical protein